MSRKTATRTLVLAATAAAVLAFGAAQARDALSPSPERILARATADLALTAPQQAHAGALIRRALQLRLRVRDEGAALVAASRAELARPDADLQALATERRQWVDARLAEVRLLEADAVAFYEHELTPAQQAQARERLGERLERLQGLGERLRAWRDDPLFPL
jgi:hypothetical protein